MGEHVRAFRGLIQLAYYIAAINIEAVFHSLVGGEYRPFEGICLTDTFQLYEKEDLISSLMVDNSSRRQRQKQLDIRVIVGNPPYSAGQNSANDNNANIAYPSLDSRIRETYAAQSAATLKNALYDSYIRAIRWGSDRLGDAGVMAYVSNAGWIDGNATDGLRKCLAEEFASLYVFHLRGNQRTSGELSKKEGGKIFGSGSRAPIAISLFVKNPIAKDRGKIFFHDIGDYLTREDKLSKVRDFGSVQGISAAGGWSEIEPDEHNDWLRQRDGSFKDFIALGGRGDGGSPVLFETYSRGILTARDAWCYNFSGEELLSNVRRMASFYNNQLDRIPESGTFDIDKLIDTNPAMISWSVNLKRDAERRRRLTIDPLEVYTAVYRPFTKQHIYKQRSLVERPGKANSMFPDDRGNRVIAIKGNWRQTGQIALMVDCIHTDQSDGGSQCFPLLTYDANAEHPEGGLFSSDAQTGAVRDGITDSGHQKIAAAYPSETITKEDVFYYAYGILHSEDYRDRFADNLSKELPRIPCVRTVQDFWLFVKAGRALGDLHVGYEDVEPYPITYKQGSLALATINDPKSFYRVEKMKFGGKRPNIDKTTVVYNSNITMTEIPLDAYDYVVNGKPALEWIMERQCVKTDKDSGIVNDANRYAIETVNDPAYPLKLFQRVITVSLETMKIVKGLPKLEI